MIRSALALAVLFAAACERIDGEAAYSANECRRVVLLDKARGDPIIGVEDMAVDPQSGRIFLSAYDRRAAESALKAGRAPIPEGGLYELSMDALLDENGERELSLSSIIPAGAVAGGLRPHGVSLDAAGARLFVINRSASAGRRFAPELLSVSIDDQSATRVSSLHCAANDLAEDAAQIVYTIDHGACGAGAALEDMFGLRHGGVRTIGGGAPVSGTLFANGVLAAEDGIIYAETRLRRVTRIGESEISVRLPGGPDNLSIANDGDIIAALHPSLPKMGLARKLGVGRAGSRIVRIRADFSGYDLLFDDPSGNLFSAASIAIDLGGGLLVGSALDEGVLLCREQSE